MNAHGNCRYKHWRTSISDWRKCRVPVALVIVYDTLLFPISLIWVYEKNLEWSRRVAFSERSSNKVFFSDEVEHKQILDIRERKDRDKKEILINNLIPSLTKSNTHTLLLSYNSIVRFQSPIKKWMDGIIAFPSSHSLSRLLRVYSFKWSFFILSRIIYNLQSNYCKFWRIISLLSLFRLSHFLRVSTFFTFSQGLSSCHQVWTSYDFEFRVN